MPRISTMWRKRICRCRVRCRRCTSGTRIRAFICRFSRPAGRSAPIAGRSTRSNPSGAPPSGAAFGGGGDRRLPPGMFCSPVGLVRFLLDDPRAERDIHALLDGRALVIEDVDGPGELDEVAVKSLYGLLPP